MYSFRKRYFISFFLLKIDCILIISFESRRFFIRSSNIFNIFLFCFYSSFFNRQSSIVNSQSSIGNRQSSIGNRQSSIVNRQSSFVYFHFCIFNFHFTLIVFVFSQPQCKHILLDLKSLKFNDYFTAENKSC